MKERKTDRDKIETKGERHTHTQRHTEKDSKHECLPFFFNHTLVSPQAILPFF